MSDQNGLKGGLGLWQVVFLAAGGMIGAAVFSLSGLTAAMAGPSAILAWVLAGMLMILVAVNFAELATAFPRIGGVAHYPLETLGPNRGVRAFFGFVTGWSWAWTELIGAAFSALVLYQFLGVALVPWGVVISVVVLAAVYILNIVGISPTVKVNFILFLLLALTMVIFFFAGIGKVEMGNYSPFFATGSLGFLSAIPIAALGFGAWMVITSLAAEIKEPKKNIPRAILYSLIFTLVLYFLMLFVTYGTVPSSSWSFANDYAVYAAPDFAATMFAGGALWIMIVIKIAAVLALVTTVTALFADASRVFCALGQTGIMPSFLGKINAKSGQPLAALTWVFVFTILMNIFLYDKLAQIITVGSIFLALAFLISLFASIGLKTFRRDVKPPYRAPGGIAAPIIGIIALGFLIWNVFTTALDPWGAGALYILGGVGLLWFIIIAITKTGIFSKDSKVGRLGKEA